MDVTPDVTFSYAINDQVTGHPHEVTATRGGQVVGWLQWSRRSGLIVDVRVVPEARRQGIATALLAEARRIAQDTRGVKPPRYSADRTDDGDAWARSLGGRLPRRISRG